MKDKEYIEIPYRKIGKEISEGIAVKLTTFFFLSLISAVIFDINFKEFKSTAVLEQASISKNSSIGSLPVGIGNLLSNNQLSSKSTSFYIKSLNSFDFFEFMLANDDLEIFKKDILKNEYEKYEKYEKFKIFFSSSIDDLGFISVEVKCRNWLYCENLLNFILAESNKYIKEEYKSRSNLNIESIMKQIESSNNVSVNNALLAEVIDEMIIKSRSESDTGYVFPIIQQPYSDRQPAISSVLVFLIIFIVLLLIYSSKVFLFKTFLNK